MAKAAGRFQSFEDAAAAMEMVGVQISSRHLQRIANEIGSEMAQQRDRKVAIGRRRLPVRVASTPEVVAVEVDGGRLRTRAPECGPGVHEASNKEDKLPLW
jgi:hypothetical protein